MNVYVHFPFCRSKCAYCALRSYVGRSVAERNGYARKVACDLERLFASKPEEELSTLYFGGGTPAMCDLSPVLEAVARSAKTAQGAFEFTVELNPLDATPDLLQRLKRGGVNRISMGVQSFDDATLRSMGRPHTAEQARNAWKAIRDSGFGNAGIDLICGWPSDRHGDEWRRTLDEALLLAPDHCSVYTLILEPGTRLALDVKRGRCVLPPDEDALAELAAAERALSGIGLERYEISNFSKPGMECRHNLAVWRGEDYIGIGDGACSREGNAVSRVIFRLRLLKEGFSPSKAAEDFPELASRVGEWRETLDRFAEEGLLTATPPANADGAPTYRLTARGAEVCDTILAELV